MDLFDATGIDKAEDKLPLHGRGGRSEKVNDILKQMNCHTTQILISTHIAGLEHKVANRAREAALLPLSGHKQDVSDPSTMWIE